MNTVKTMPVASGGNKMKTWMEKLMVALAVAGMASAVAGCRGKSAGGGRLTVRDGGREWTFVAVEGESHLNLEQDEGNGENRGGAPDTVTMPRFWIATEPVTEGDFAEWMGREVREGKSADQPVAEIEWEEAVECCSRFTERYTKQLPRGVFATLPTMQEWMHAVKVLGYPDWLAGETGTFIFTRNQYGGVLCSPKRDLPVEGYDLATTLVTVSKRGKRDYAGLRLVLVDIAGGEILANGKPYDNTMVSRGVILLQNGLFEPAVAQLERALAEGNLDPEQRERAEDALAFARQEHETGYEDWAALVTLAARSAEGKGFATWPFTELWATLGTGETMENPVVAFLYATNGIVGEWVAIGNLPEDIKEKQPLGETNSIMVPSDDAIDTREFTISPEHVVQVLRCDFTGDGVEDMVVEDFGSVGSDGYWYDFFEGKPDGGHVLRESLQTVGLCVLPRAGGGACGFINIEKYDNPVLSADILTFQDGEAVYESALDQPVAMIDVFPDQIYIAVPFIGPGYGLGWKLMEGRGYWYRPLFWPWQPGTVQGL